MANRIAELRHERGLTLKSLGERIGLRDNTISQYETGKREPKLETWQKLADALDVSVPYLQGISDDKRTPEQVESFYKEENETLIKLGATGEPFNPKTEQAKGALLTVAKTLSILEVIHQSDTLSATVDFLDNSLFDLQNLFFLDEDQESRNYTYEQMRHGLESLIAVAESNLKHDDSNK